MLLPTVTHWSSLINFIIQNYFMDSIATCILWPQDMDFQLSTGNDKLQQFININTKTLTTSADRNMYSQSVNTENSKQNEQNFYQLVKKLTESIESSHCESFIAFQEDIPLFAPAFRNASFYSIWRSENLMFLFVYSKEQQKKTTTYFDDLLFSNQPNILIITAETLGSSVFELKTNKFVGSLRAHPEQLYTINTYDAVNNSFATEGSLYPHKLKDMQGREVILSSFDYRPFVVFDDNNQPQVRDNAADKANHTIFVDGTEVRILISFCEFYNCTLEVDTTEKGEWGRVYENLTATGLTGMVLGGRAQMVLGGFYPWSSFYEHMDLTAFLGRSGITCLVPAPNRLISWNLPLKPFRFSLWLAVIACLVLEAISLLVTRRLELKEEGESQNSWRHSLQFGYITTLKLFISQSSDYIVQSATVRIVLFSCYTIDIILTSIYGGGLASILTLPILGEAPDSLERMYKFGLPWGATSYIWLETIREVKDDPIIVSLYNSFNIYTYQEMRAKAKTEYMGFTLERLAFGHFGNVDFIDQEALNRLKLMVDDIYYQYTVAFVPRNWALLQKYNNLIYAWHSSGFDKFWEWKIAALYMNAHYQEQIKASSIANPDVGPVELDISNFAGIIVIWVAGMTISCMAFGFEILYFNYHKRPEMRKLIVI